MNLIMIQPILPILPVNPPQFSAETMIQILTFTVFLAAVGMTAFFLSLYAAKRWNGNKKKTTLAFIGISIAVAALLLCFFGCTVSAVRGILFCLILMFSSYSDIKTREADDCLPVMIVLTAFIGRNVSDIPGMMLSAVLITLPIAKDYDKRLDNYNLLCLCIRHHKMADHNEISRDIKQCVIQKSNVRCLLIVTMRWSDRVINIIATKI